MKALTTLLLPLTLLAGVSASAASADAARLDEVAERGAQVMPFDLDKTVHVFDKTGYGGKQEVFAKQASDTEQIRLIREHLSAIAAAFSRGDFSGPARIHGAEMPGLAQLQAAQPGQIKFEYQDLPDGARLDYSASDPALIDAIHRYFDAQLSDHAHHAVSHRKAHGQMH